LVASACADGSGITPTSLCHPGALTCGVVRQLRQRAAWPRLDAHRWTSHGWPHCGATEFGSTARSWRPTMSACATKCRGFGYGHRSVFCQSVVSASAERALDEPSGSSLARFWRVSASMTMKPTD